MAMEGRGGGSPAAFTRRRFLAAALALLALPLALVGRRLVTWGSSPGLPVDLPRRADNLLVEREGAGWRLTPLPANPQGPVFRLNDAALRVWRASDGRHTAADLAAELSRAYGIGAERAQADVLVCLNSLARLGLISS
jgi:hypothetical protein